MTYRLLRIATRRSALALWQAEHVAARLRAMHPECEVGLVPMSTRGDETLDRPLSEIGGKGLFLKELEIALLNDRADIAVHSLKDVPMDLEAGFAIGAVLERADPADAFVSTRHLRLDDAAARGARRHVLSAPPGAIALGTPRSENCRPARQREYAAGQARRGRIRRDHSRLRGA